jgi:hypothetical protein
MNLIFVLLFSFIFIIPFSLLKKLYAFDSPDYKIAKLLNIIVCLFLIFYVSIADDNFRSLQTDFNSFKQKYLIEVGGINKWIIFIGKLAFMTLNVYLVIIILNLTQRSKKYRKRFLYFLPFFALLQSLDTYRIAVDKIDQPWNTLILFSLLISLMLFLPIFLIYVSRPFKNMMNLDKDKRLEILEMGKIT